MRSPAAPRAVCALALALSAALPARADDIDYKKLYAKVAPGVVLVYGEAGQTGSVGSGSIIREDGLVVTNAHVILDHETKKPYEKLFIFLKPDVVTGHNEQDLKKGFAAQWIIYSADMDLALLRIVDAPKGLTVVPLADDKDIGVGEATAAIGHPESGAKWSLTTGRIGGTWTDFDGVKGKDVYQMETSVNRGNSGGPLLDGNGYLIGINTSIARRSADGLAITGVNFAIQSRVVRQWIASAHEEIAAAPDLSAPAPSAVAQAPVAAPPPAAEVARAQPPPPAEERAPAPGAAPRDPSLESLPRPQEPSGAEKQTTISSALPAAPPRGRRGFTSAEKPGRVLSPKELTAARAKKAFDDLDAEGAKHGAH